MKVKNYKRRLITKRASLCMAIIMLAETIWPTASMALTSGPSSPEFSSFEPVATTNMVNEFSGDFTYNLPVLNIPGPDGAGYALSLSYHSGESVESESSWVGYGWTLNPGAINRTKRGFADDSRAEHTFFNDVPKNWTASVGTSIGDPELFSIDIPLSLSAGLRYNNYKGFGYTAGIGLSVKGIVSIGYSVSDGSGSFSAQVNPAGLLALGKKKKEQKEKQKQYYDKGRKEDKQWTNKKPKTDASKDENQQKQEQKQKATAAAGKILGPLGGMASAYGMHAFGDVEMPTTVAPYTGRSFNVSLNADLDPGPVPIGLTMGLSGNYTQQENEAIKVRRGYGYLYSYDAYSDNQGAMDYYTEKDSPYNKRDRYMGIPFSNADLYSVTGEGLGGGFRLHNRQVGRFRTNSAVSKTQIYQTSIEFNLGLTIGAGTDFGVGLQTLSVNDNNWGQLGTYEFAHTDDEPYFFRFNNDLGGDVDYGKDELVTAYINGKNADLTNSGSGTNYQRESMVSTIDHGAGTIARSGRSSYIGYNTYYDIANSYNSKRYMAYDKHASTSALRSNGAPQEQIAEFATVNEDGNTYVYGIPVLTKNEKNMSYSMENGTVNNNFLGYKNINGSNKMKVGTQSNDPYATAYLLTQITTPDYVDRTLNGPTGDDFGGYTRFVYKKLPYQYHWRMPYTGLSYSKGDISNPGDDMGSFSSGDKDIFYLDTIVTKTHIAVFKTSTRYDGKDADNDMSAANNPGALGTKSLLRLDSICLYLNNGSDGPGKLIKKTIFSYDYELCPGTKNSTAAGQRKLTLKKVWFEYEGIVSAKISPYKFYYTYADLSSTTKPYPYYDSSNPDKFNDYASIIGAPSAQNPAYNPTVADAWGNYQENSATRYSDLKHHLNQNPSSTFDPAAWQLKQIALPSGGEIHIFYEQDDYQYVQDRRAMALVSLKSGYSNGDESVFRLEVENDLGYSSTADKQALADLMKAELSNEKIYFKFLYAMVGSNPGVNQCNSEYVSGYVNFNSAGLDGANTLTISVGGGTHSLPVDICKDLVKKEKGGKINQTGNCDPAVGIDDNNSAKDVVIQLLNKLGTVFEPSSLCTSIKPELSYFKIPLLKAKKGGGIRVKRLLMYDPDGVDQGSAALYGTEYIYKLENGMSSGVASNEPATIREENPLVTFLPKRRDQTFLQKAISGIDREQFEGPLGESLLPAPAVGYSRVVAKNIHNGKTSTGFVVSEFYTTKDFPYDMSYDIGKGVDCTDINDQTFDKFWLMIPAVFVNISINNIWASQGFRFIKNNMNGQPKSVATYAGNYTSGSLSLSNKSSSTEYEYFKPGEKVKVLNDDGSTPFKELGKEMEIAMEGRSVEDITEDISNGVDASIGLTPPVVYIPYFTGSGSLSYAERKLNTHVTSKVIEYPVIQKSVTSMQDGITHKTENILFSRFTGKPVRVVTSDGFDGQTLQQSASHVGIYTKYDIPGYMQYRELGQKAINQRLIVNASTNLLMRLSGSGTGPHTLQLALGSGPGVSAGTLCNALGALSVGDLLLLNSGSSKYFFHVDGINGTNVTMYPAGNFNGTVNASSPISISSFQIISSGRTNQLNSNVGSYTVYGGSNSTATGDPKYTNKQNFVTTLNAALSACVNGTGNSSGGSSHLLNLNSSTVDFLNTSTGSCMHGIDAGYQMAIGMQPLFGTNRFEIRIYQTTASSNEVCTNQDVYLVAPGSFSLNSQTGKIIYTQSSMPCVSYEVKCLQFCSPTGAINSISNVVSASASTLNHIWRYNQNIFDLTGTNANKNDYETGAKGKWRITSAYVYKAPVVGGAIENASVHQRIYKDAGTFTMEMFNWKNLSMNDSTKWIRTSTVTKYTPNGNAIEEKDAIHLYSAAKYGYAQTVPYMVAQNATYDEAFFESFEVSYPVSSNLYLEEKVKHIASDISSAYAHSGSKSLVLGTKNFTITETNLTPKMSNEGISVKVWVKDPQRTQVPVKGSIVGNVTVPLNFAKIAQTGEWSLYEAKVTNWSGMTTNMGIKVLLVNNVSGQSDIYVDDYRLQPLKASMNAYVYDVKTLRLLASFDDQHFALFYQYNDEGKLVRKLKETERGTKTIAETQYNLPKVNR